MVTASIITIGDELLIGQVTDTNSGWIAQQLNKAGVTVKRRVAVGDQEEEIIHALNEECRLNDIILITGGLGPTSDDITKPVLAKYFNSKMITNKEVLKNVKHLFEEVFKKPITEDNRKQALVPDNCIVIQNKRGTAPGMCFKKDGKLIVSMPGVPFEMQGMLTDFIIPTIRDSFNLPYIVHFTLLCSGAGESTLSTMLSEFEKNLPEYIKLAYLPSFGLVRLRLTSTGRNKELLEKEVLGHFEEMKKIVMEYLVADKDVLLADAVGKILINSGKSVSTAESCTGGYIAHLFTSIPGCSSFYKGTIVSYDNEIKKRLLNVSEKTLHTYGAVSEETVREMLTGLLSTMHTDYGIAVSGIMGPSGGTTDKPVGTVWIAVGNKSATTVKKFQLRFDRIKNIEITAQNSIDMLRRFIISHSGA